MKARGLQALRRALLAGGALLVLGVSASQPARAGAYEDFFLGIELDRPGIVRPLLAKGFDVNARDPHGQHGLYIALRENSTEVQPLLLEHPELDPNATNAANETLLMMAALRGNLPAMRRLIARGAKVNRDGWTPLHYAASGPDPAAVELLLAEGADMNARAPNGNTPLMLASGVGSVDAAYLLARRGADVSLRNKAGASAADYARGDRDRLAADLDKLAARTAKP